LVLKYDLFRLPSEAVEKIPMLLKLQEEFRQWAAAWLRDRGSLPGRNLRHVAKAFIYGGKMLDWVRNLEKSGVKVNKLQIPLFFDAQLRLCGEERDVGRGVLVNFHLRELRIRKWGGGTLVLLLDNNAVEWIQERLREGGKLVLAAVWVGPSKSSRAAKLYVALIFRREVAPAEAKRILVVDFNALHNGLVWAVVEGERVATKGVFRPDVSRIMHMQKVISRLDSICARKDKACGEAVATKSRVWRMVNVWEDEVIKKLLHLAKQYKAGIVIDLPKSISIRMLREGRYNPRKKMLLKFGRLRRKLETLARWYGIPLRIERLYSSMCPRCDAKMSTLPNRRVKCRCGFEAHRDEVPFYWAAKLCSKLTSFSNSTSKIITWEAFDVDCRAAFRRLHAAASNRQLSAFGLLGDFAHTPRSSATQS
jgi:putative transposase